MSFTYAPSVDRAPVTFDAGRDQTARSAMKPNALDRFVKLNENALRLVNEEKLDLALQCFRDGLDGLLHVLAQRQELIQLEQLRYRPTLPYFTSSDFHVDFPVLSPPISYIPRGICHIPLVPITLPVLPHRRPDTSLDSSFSSYDLRNFPSLLDRLLTTEVLLEQYRSPMRQMMVPESPFLAGRSDQAPAFTPSSTSDTSFRETPALSDVLAEREYASIDCFPVPMCRHTIALSHSTSPPNDFESYDCFFRLRCIINPMQSEYSVETTKAVRSVDNRHKRSKCSSDSVTQDGREQGRNTGGDTIFSVMDATVVTATFLYNAAMTCILQHRLEVSNVNPTVESTSDNSSFLIDALGYLLQCRTVLVGPYNDYCRYFHQCRPPFGHGSSSIAMSLPSTLPPPTALVLRMAVLNNIGYLFSHRCDLNAVQEILHLLADCVDMTIVPAELLPRADHVENHRINDTSNDDAGSQTQLIGLDLSPEAVLIHNDVASTRTFHLNACLLLGRLVAASCA